MKAEGRAVLPLQTIITPTLADTPYHTAFLPQSSSIRKHIKASRPAQAAAASGTKGSEKQHEKKARETRVRDDGFLSSAFSTHSPLCSFGGSALLYSRCTGPDVEEPCLIMSMKIKLQIDTRGDSN